MMDQEVIKIPKDDEILVIKMGSDEYPISKIEMDQMNKKIMDLGINGKVLILAHDIDFQKINPENHYLIKVGTDEFPADDERIKEVRNLLSENLKHITVVKHNLTLVD